VIVLRVPSQSANAALLIRVGVRSSKRITSSNELGVERSWWLTEAPRRIVMFAMPISSSNRFAHDLILLFISLGRDNRAPTSGARDESAPPKSD
jgi:hypothetical protein